MVIWIISGIFLAALFHSFVNLFASSGHYMAILLEAIGWICIIFFFLHQHSQRPYGRILQEIKLMQHLHDIQIALNQLQHPISEQNISHFERNRIRLSRNQFAKK